jgi:hypothetical protein
MPEVPFHRNQDDPRSADLKRHQTPDEPPSASIVTSRLPKGIRP